jgi:MFS family permease
VIERASPGQRGGAGAVYLVAFADAAGLGLYLAISAVFLSHAVRLPDREIGFVLGGAGLASLAGTVPVAQFAQRHGLRRSLVMLSLARAAAFGGLACTVNFTTALLAAAAGGLLNRGIAPLIQAVLIADADQATAVARLARLRAVRNAGLAAGGLPAGVAVAIGTQWSYRSVVAGTAVLFVSCALTSRRLPTAAGQPRQSVHRRAVSQLRPVFLVVVALFGALTLATILLGVGLPLWISQDTHAPGWSIGLIQILNTLLVVVLQVRVSKGSEQPRRGRRMMFAGGWLAAAGAATAPLSGLGRGVVPLAAVVLVVLLMTMAELYISAGAMSLALAYTPPTRRTAYLATFNLGFAAATVVGPTLVSAGLGSGRPGWFAWAVAFGLLGSASLAVPVASSPPDKQPPDKQPPDKEPADAHEEGTSRRDRASSPHPYRTASA